MGPAGRRHAPQARPGQPRAVLRPTDAPADRLRRGPLDQRAVVARRSGRLHLAGRTAELRHGAARAGRPHPLGRHRDRRLLDRLHGRRRAFRAAGRRRGPRAAMTSIAIVGAGFGGVGAAVMLRRAGYHDVVVFERGERVGGVWHHNTYPGAACDVPSHLYEFSFEPNPRWSRRYAPQAEIQAYLEDVARRNGVLDRIRTGTEVQDARWDEDSSKWILQTTAGEHEADVLVTACGQLSVPSVPPLEGLDSFEGPAFHTAQWRHDVDLAGKRVAVIGTGCSAIQVVPAIQPEVDSIAIYQRSPGWTIPKMDYAYSERTQRLFERFPVLQRMDRAAVFGFMELGAAAMTSRRWLLHPFRAMARWNISKAIKDPELRAKVTPADEVGCKRIMLTDEWYPTLTKPNVELVTDRVAQITPAGVRTEDGIERAVDVLILA